MPGNNYGSFIPTSNVWDINEPQNLQNVSPELRELLVRLYQNLNNMALSVNTRDAGYYDNANEFVNGQLWFPNPANTSATSSSPVMRQVYRKVVNFGTLPNNATTSVAHGLTITSGFSFTRIYGVASDPVNLSYIPLPYSSATAAANNLELYVDGTNVNVTTGIDYTAYTVTYIILEYIKF